MSKVYIITETEMNMLRERLELTKLRHIEGKGIHDPKRQDTDDMYRWFNYEVGAWINMVTK